MNSGDMFLVVLAIIFLGIAGVFILGTLSFLLPIIIIIVVVCWFIGKMTGPV